MTSVTLKVYFNTSSPYGFYFKLVSATGTPSGYNIEYVALPTEGALSSSQWACAGTNQAICYKKTSTPYRYIPVVVCLGPNNGTAGAHYLNYFDGTGWMTLNGSDVGSSASAATEITACIPEIGSTVNVSYGNKQKTVAVGGKLTLQCSGKLMTDDVVIDN